MPAIATVTLCALAMGCGGSSVPVVASAACAAPADELLAALERAPGRVTLEGGTTLSACITGSRNPGDLQTIGATMTEAAEQLERTAPRDPDAALRLGYLIGAARRGSQGQIGITDELVRRLERAADLSRGTSAAQAALARGLAAGEARG